MWKGWLGGSRFQKKKKEEKRGKKSGLSFPAYLCLIGVF